MVEILQVEAVAITNKITEETVDSENGGDHVEMPPE